MSACKYVEGEYLLDGEPCRTDDYGDPTRHCTARKTCSEHIGYGELTCAKCLGRTRTDIRVIRDRTPELVEEAIEAGVNSEAANLAGPACDYGVFSARRNLDRLWLMTNIPGVNLERAMKALLADDDEWHPYSVLTRWHAMLAEDYGHELPETMTVSNSAAYLERMLPRMAHDEEQDFPLFAREIRKCRNHVENVLSDSQQPERGAPCPDCKDAGHVVRLTREYGHFCDDPECDRMNYSVIVVGNQLLPDTSGDVWVCPRDHSHNRSHKDYSAWVEERAEMRHETSA